MLEAQYDEPPLKFLKLPSGTIARYRDYAGENSASETLVLLHGGNTSLECWDPWMERLRGSMRMVAMDLPGHGLTGVTIENDYSPAGAVVFVDAFTRTLGLNERLTLVGHSTGGQIAWRFAVLHPERLAKLVLIAPGGISPPRGPQAQAIRLAAIPGGSLLLRLLMSRKTMRAGLQAVFDNKSVVTPEMVDRYWTMSQGPGMRQAMLARLRAPTFDPDMIARLGEIQLPTLLLWGRDDLVFPLELSRRFTDAMATAKLFVYDRCGHFPMEEFPDRSVGDLRAFLKDEMG